MQKVMESEKAEAIATLQRANDLLFKMFGISSNCNGCGAPYDGDDDCPDCRCSDTCGCTDEERGLI